MVYLCNGTVWIDASSTDRRCGSWRITKMGDSYVALKDPETSLKRSGSTTEIGIGGTLIGSSVSGYLEVATPDPVVCKESQY